MLIMACGWDGYIVHGSRDTAEGNGLNHLAGSRPQEGSPPGQGTPRRGSAREAAPPHGERTSMPLVSARCKARVPPLPVLTSTWEASRGEGATSMEREPARRKLSQPQPPALQEEEEE